MKPWKRCYLKGKNGHGIFVMLKTGLLWSTIFKSSNVLPLPHQNKKRRQKEQIFDQSIELEKRVKCMGDPLDGDNSIVEYLPESQCKTCKSQWASHLRIGLCKLSHVSNHIYATYLSKNMECPEILLHN